MNPDCALFHDGAQFFDGAPEGCKAAPRHTMKKKKIRIENKKSRTKAFFA